MKDLVLTSNVPQAKKILETLLFEVKIMLDNNKCLQAFWIGNLRHRNIAGNFVSSQFVQESKEIKEDVKANIDDIDSALNNGEDDDEEHDIDKLLGSEGEGDEGSGDGKENQGNVNQIKKELIEKKKKSKKNKPKSKSKPKSKPKSKSKEIINESEDEISEDDKLEARTLSGNVKTEAPEIVINSSQLTNHNNSPEDRNSNSKSTTNKNVQIMSPKNMRNSGEVVENISLEMEISPIKVNK